jgi:Heparinase II/III-like protein/Heparinase II/III N-terminus
MNSVDLEWRIRRLSKMSASEVKWRLSDQVRRRRWASRQIAPELSPLSWAPLSARRSTPPWDLAPDVTFHALPTRDALVAVPLEARRELIAAADEIMDGRWHLLGTVRRDMQDPDWFFDPVTGRRAPQLEYCFKVNHRAEDVTGNVKQIWELSRMHHVTVLAAAFALSRDERYADRAALHLRSWWRQNPFLSGVHWTSGIETGLRLIAWVWTRRLLSGWDKAAQLFECDEAARAQVWWHQEYLANFRSRGSSANNHVIAEAAGLLVAALSFDWFAESARWRDEAAQVLEEELRRNTFASGVNREMAFEYHGFVLELAVVAAVEAEWAGRPLSDELWALLARMFDVVAATVDVKLRAPRYGDGDDGRALVLDGPTAERWPGLLAIGESLFETPQWWPAVEPTVASSLVASMAGRRAAVHPDRRPSHYADAGLTVLRSPPSDGDEIWCRCDAGPHGYLSIAAHGHADALAVEVRHNGTDVLADPGTYCYHGEPGWRTYFRSTLAHNTVEVAGSDQSASGGPFLWTRHARSTLIGLESDADGELTSWSAEHDGYLALTPPLRHRRSVRLVRRLRRLEIVDDLETTGGHPFRLAFLLGPAVDARMAGHEVGLTWTEGGSEKCATLSLPEVLTWTLARGATDPHLGWYSARFGEKQPTWALVGEGLCSQTGLDTVTTVLQFGSQPHRGLFP